ncbi:MAG TPA: ribonucleotide reductase N-terminal alpha domain-containing protein, partial [Gammaproteobacteria bacterium]|nr:ribonucleotide reductase N-terminal alpha domain-containing protein [Gammaproteobacteria bacterium]
MTAKAQALAASAKPVQVDFQSASLDIWDKKYRLKDLRGNPVDEDVDATYRRVARALADVEEADKREAWYERFLWALRHGAIPAGRIISNAGGQDYKPATSTINCTVSGTVDDSMDGILSKVHEAGLTLKAGCGIGYDFSTLRPKGAFVAGAGAITSGPLSFMDIFDRMCFTISSAGGRRGAQMATFDVGHPDVADFIRAKREDGRLRQFNMSLLVTHEFMEAVKSDDWWRLAFPLTDKQAEVEEVDLQDPEQVVWRDWPNKEARDYVTGADGRVACKVFKTIKARHLWNAIMSSTYDYAEPGFILIDQYNDMNNNWYVENIRATNPCVTGDTLLLTDRGEVPIQEVVGESLQVWNGFEWSQVTPKVTGHDRNILRVHFDNGTYLDCTLNHKFVLADGRRVEAQDLVVGECLQAFSLPLAATGTSSGQERASVAGTRITAKEAMGIADTVYCVTEPKNHTAVFNGLMTGNCGEQGLPPYGACLLGSVNLTQFVREPFTDNARFDWEQYREVVAVFTRMLDNVVEISGLPLDEQQEEIRRKRRHGMGFLGLGSTLAMLRMKYGEPDSVAFTEQVARELAETGWKTAAELAQEKGPAPIMAETFTVDEEMLRLRPEMASDGYQAGDQVPGRVLMARYSRYMQQFPAEVTDDIAEHGARFTHHSSIAPTGTISLSLANNASNGIEPSFAHQYFRNVIRDGRKSKEKVEVDSYELLAYRQFVDPEAGPEAEGEHALPDYFVDTNTIQPWQHVEIQAAAQKWIDSSISKTINVPQDFDFQDFKDIALEGLGVEAEGGAGQGPQEHHLPLRAGG